MRFSQRKGLKPAQKLLQLDGMDTELRNGLWSCYLECVLGAFKGPEDYIQGRMPYVIQSNMESLFKNLWIDHFKWPVDTMPNNINEVTRIVRQHFFECPWNEVYDFLEFWLGSLAMKLENSLRTCCNVIMDRENAGYRIVGTHVVEITNEQELASIDTALESPVAGTRQHLLAAVSLLSDRKSPDYRNSIKESISAVEATARSITGDPKATLGSALGLLQQKLGLHQALKAGFSSLYGYTSDGHGIRHAMLEEPHLKSSDAKFMLVACSAFVNYLIEKASEAGVKLH